MRYRRDVPRADTVAVETERAHVVAHLSSVADLNDDPETHASQVQVQVLDHVDGDVNMVSIIGDLDLEPDAPYLRPGYDPDDDADRSPFIAPGDDERRADA